MAVMRINIIVDDKGNIKLKGVKGHIDNINKSLHTLSSTARLVKGALLGAIGVLGIREVERAAKSWMDLSRAQSMAEEQLRATMISTGRYSKEFYQNALNMAQGVRELTGETEAAIIQGQKMMISFGEISADMLPRVTEAMANIAVFGGRTMEQAARIIGRASIGMTGELRRLGVAVDDDTFKLHGFEGMLEAIEKQFGGQIYTLKNSYGAWKILGGNIKETKRYAGDFLNAMVIQTGILSEVIDKLQGWNRELDKLKESGKLDEWAVKVAKIVIIQIANIVEKFEDLAFFIKEMLPASIEPFARKIKEIFNQVNKMIKAIIGASLMGGAGSFLSPLGGAIGAAMGGIAGYNWDKELEAIKKIKKEWGEFAEWTTKIVLENRLEALGRLIDEVNRKREELRKPIIEKGAAHWWEIPTEEETKLKRLNEDLRNLQSQYNEIQLLLRKNVTPIPEKIFGADPKQAAQATHEYSNALKEYTNEIDEYFKLQQEIKKWEGDFFGPLPDPSKLPKKQTEEKQTEDFTQMWDKAADSMANAFANAFADILYEGKLNFEKLGDSIKRIMADTVAEIVKKKLFQPIIDQAMGRGVVYPSDYTGELPEGSYRSSLYFGEDSNTAKYIATAAMAYSMYDQYKQRTLTPVSGALQGAMIGSMWAPGIGTAIGGVIGGIAGLFTPDDAKKEIEPKIHTLWKVIGDHVELISSSWEDISAEEGNKLIWEYKKALESQTEFFARLNNVFGVTSDYQIGFGGEIANISQEDLKGKEAMLNIMNNLISYSKIMPEKFSEDVKTVWEMMMDSMSSYVGIKWISHTGGMEFPNVQNWAHYYYTWPGDIPLSFNEVASSGISIEQLKEVIGQSILSYFSDKLEDPEVELMRDIGDTAIEIIDKIIDATGEEWVSLVDQLQEKLIPFQDSLIQTISGAFMEVPQTEGFLSFKESLKASLANSIKSSFSEMLGAQFVSKFTDMLMPSFATVEEYIQKAISGDFIGFLEAQGLDTSIYNPSIAWVGPYGPNTPYHPPSAEETAIDYVTSQFTEAMDNLAPIIEDMQPVWDAFHDALNQIYEALGVNTEALEENTSAILGPVESYLRELETSLAPVMSLAGLETLKEKYFTEALADPAKFSAYASYMTGSYWPQAQATDTNYPSLIEAEKARVENIPWVSEARNIQITGELTINPDGVATIVAQEIGTNPELTESIDERVRLGG